MKPFFQHLQVAVIAITVAWPAIAMAEPKLEMHRVGAKADDGSGWHLAVSSKGSFSVLLPIPFNDFTTNDAATGETLASIPKALAATPANKVSDVSRSSKGGVDILTLTMANATTTLYMRCIQLNDVRYTLTIEFPNAYRELVAANRDRFFESFKLKAKS